jgi:hypothetical protein
MRPLLLALPALGLGLICAAPDARAGAGAAGQVAEIVTFRLLPGTDEAAFLDAARATEGPLAARPGFLRRSLSRDEAGLWTDYVEWADLASAESAAQAMMPLPEFGPFIAAIDPASMQISHRTILWRMGN